MNKKTFDRIRMATAAILAIIVSISVARGNYWVPLIAVAAVLVTMFAMRKKVTGVINDERDYHLAGNAARWTVSIYAILTSLGSIVFMALRTSDPVYGLLGNLFAYSACFVITLNSALFYYFERKGDGEIKTDDKN